MADAALLFPAWNLTDFQANPHPATIQHSNTKRCLYLTRSPKSLMLPKAHHLEVLEIQRPPFFVLHFGCPRRAGMVFIKPIFEFKTVLTRSLFQLGVEGLLEAKEERLAM